MKEETETVIKNGKPWDLDSTFDSFVDADKRRNQKNKEWEENSTEGMQVKVKRRNSDGKYLVKVRLHPDFEPKKEKKKKNGKNSRRNKKDTNTGEAKSS